MSEKFAEFKMEIFKIEEDTESRHRQHTSKKKYCFKFKHGLILICSQDHLNEVWNVVGIIDSKIEQLLLPKKKRSKIIMKDLTNFLKK